MSNKHWAIKQRDGQEKDAADYWNEFRKENVIALGWGKGLGIDPREIETNQLSNKIQKVFGKTPLKAGRISKEIKRFAGQENGINPCDIVWVIGGFAPTQTIKPVHIFGVAQVEGDLCCDWNSTWWIFKRRSKIFSIEHPIGIDEAEKCFGKRAMQETLYSLSNDSFKCLCDELFKKYGIVIPFRE